MAHFPLVLADDIEVQIAESKHHMTIAGVIEFVSLAGNGPVQRVNGSETDVWCYPARIDDPLPSVPLVLRRGPLIMLELEETLQRSASG